MSNPIRPAPGDRPVIGARRRLRALAYLGHSTGTLARWCGTDERTVELILNCRHQGVTPALDDRITCAFDRWCMTFGTSAEMAERARQNHWPSSLAWYDIDIDDPDAHPDRGQRVITGYDELDVEIFLDGHAGSDRLPEHLSWDSRAARDEAIRRLNEAGLETHQISNRIAWPEWTVQRTRKRLDLLEPARELVAS